MSGHALFCAPELPDAERQSGSRRLVNLIEFLREAGWFVTVVSDNPGRPEDRRRLNDLGVATHPGTDLAALLRSSDFDIAVLAFWTHAERLIDTIRNGSPRTKVVVDSLDLHFLRAARKAFEQRTEPRAVIGSDLGGEFVRELNVYARADAVLTVSEKEAALVADLANNRVLAACVPDSEDTGVFAPVETEREGVVFVGNFQHPPNRDAVEFLCREIVPLVPDELLREDPISVVGHALHGESLALCQRTPGVKPVGWVPTLLPYLRQARVSIVPLRYGAGTKRKLIQAMLVGTPTVATGVAVEGIDVGVGDGVLVAHDAPDFARTLADLLADEARVEAMRGQGRAAAVASHSRQLSAAAFAEALEIILGATDEMAMGALVTPPAPQEASHAENGSGNGNEAASQVGVMKREWDERARENAMHYIESAQAEWSEEEFLASGRRSVDEVIVADLDRVTSGRDPRDMRALEIGCGIGRMTRHLAAIFGEIHGVDVSGEMVAEGRRRLADLDNVFLYETSGSDLAPFEDASLDFAFSFIVFQHIPYKDAILAYFREVHRTLKPGCMFKFQVQGGEIPAPDTWHGVGFDPTEMAAIAKDIGFVPEGSVGEGTQYFWHWWRRP
jgi:SAM-dependent methyltransferase/glycosyltransferase involved in cell wall biosynthesis